MALVAGIPACSGNDTTAARIADDAGSAATGGGGTSGGGTSGSGGSGTGAAAGTGGGATGPDGGGGASCSPVAHAYDPYALMGGSPKCGIGADIESHIANPMNILASDFSLPEPMQAGQKYALSLSAEATKTPGTIEIWGGSSACVADELLWYATIETKTLCAEFTPTKNHTRVTFVSRQADLLDGFFFGAPKGGFSLCPSGSCPSGADGTGLSGAPLTPPLGVYPAMSGRLLRAHDVRLGTYGRIIYLDSVNGPYDPPEPIVGGVYRNELYDPLGDAWYCIGAGSEITELPSGATHVSLKNLTRLPPCVAGGTGTASVTIQAPPSYDISTTSSFPEFSGASLILRDWYLGAAAFSFADTTQNRQSFIELRTATPWPRAFSGPLDSATTEAKWFSADDASNVIRASCAATGHVSWGADDVVKVDLSGMSPMVSCPGEPVQNDSFEFLYH